MSSTVFIAIVVIALLAFAVLVISKGGGPAKEAYPYERSKVLFTPAERSFLAALDLAIGPDQRVFGKVRVADIAQVKRGLNASARQSALNRVAAKHFDFVVCRASDLAPLYAVELDDASHAGKRTQARDAFKNKVCEAIGLPLIRIRAQSGYAIAEIKAQLTAALEGAVAGAPHRTIAPIRQQPQAAYRSRSARK